MCFKGHRQYKLPIINYSIRKELNGYTCELRKTEYKTTNKDSIQTYFMIT